ncbi:O-antigen ligase family protein [Amycolatopsis mediterranei]|uniref:O-antigen ligase family protein n=1 Tax=Amycolatopsis mediterranei TaxID=33910 RepID=UPI00114D2201|nr:hypothetical protein [Amycolatopsis mediterranei]UZF74116.1 hypothetical protein ISP_007608 [Amycolatopsis mediterranei]
MTALAGQPAQKSNRRGPYREPAGRSTAPVTGIEAGSIRLTIVVTSATLCWGVFARGAFFAADRVIFTLLTLLAVLSAWSSIERRELRWWAITLLPVSSAVVISGVANDAVAGLPLVLCPIVAAAALGLTGSAAVRAVSPARLQRILVDVTAVLGLLCWIGIGWHLTPFATALNQGWRGDAGIGYANVTGVVLGIGAIVAARLAAVSRHPADFARCTLLITAMASTQSRTVLLAALVAWGVVTWRRPRTGRVLLLVAAPAAIATVGLVPSIRGGEAHPVDAVAAAVLSGLLLAMLVRWHASVRIVTTAKILVVAIAVACGVLLRERLLDIGSAAGHLTLWRNALEKAWRGGVLGQGPGEPAALSRGEAVSILAHNDAIQFITYYGIPALAAGVWLIGRLLYRGKQAPGRSALMLSPVTGAAVLLVAVAGATDFPLQIPVVPALVAFMVGVDRGRLRRSGRTECRTQPCSIPTEKRSDHDEETH